MLMSVLPPGASKLAAMRSAGSRLACALVVAVALVGCQTLASPGGASLAPLKEASVNGVVLRYQEQGEGPPVLFVHGCCTDYRAWDAQRAVVAKHHRFIAINMRYFGTAPWPDDQSRYSQQTDVEDVAAFIRTLNAGPVDLVGWSYSGPIVLLVASRYPELVRSVAVHEPSTVTSVSDPESVKRANQDRAAALGPAIAAAKAGDLASAARLTPVGVNHQADFWETTTPELRQMFMDNARTWLLAVSAPPQPPLTCDMLRALTMPVLVTVGADTRPYFRIAAEGVAGCIPSGGRFVTIPGRHLAIAQQPEAFNAALLDFWGKVGSQ